VVYMDLTVFGSNKAFANGVVVGADTTIAGTTDTTAGDAGPGFVIVG